MDGLFNNNFLVGMLLARDLPRNEQLTTGLAAGQMPAGSPIGPILLKPLIDERAAAEKKRVVAESNVDAFRQTIEIELPRGTESATVRVSGATLSVEKSTAGVTLDPKTGAVTLPSESAEATILVATNGAVRSINIVRGPRPQPQPDVGIERTFTAQEVAALLDATARGRTAEELSSAFRRGGVAAGAGAGSGSAAGTAQREVKERETTPKVESEVAQQSEGSKQSQTRRP